MRSHYLEALDDECGLLYRPGEMSAPELNYCKLRKNHPSKRHSNRRYMSDTAGFEWVQAEEADLEWPERVYASTHDDENDD